MGSTVYLLGSVTGTGIGSGSDVEMFASDVADFNDGGGGGAFFFRPEILKIYIIFFVVFYSNENIKHFFIRLFVWFQTIKVQEVLSHNFTV